MQIDYLCGVKRTEIIKEIKRRFMAMRNGIIADTLRSAGAGYRVIFGLNVPQIVEISRDYGPDAELAAMLWADSGVRESVLLAPMLFPPDAMDLSTALEWISKAPSIEAVDMLCLKLLRHCSCAWELVELLAVEEGDDFKRYCGMRLALNCLAHNAARARELAEAEQSRRCPMTAQLAAMIIDEVDFMQEEAD